MNSNRPICYSGEQHPSLEASRYCETTLKFAQTRLIRHPLVHHSSMLMSKMFLVALVSVTIIVGMNQVSSSKADNIRECMYIRGGQCRPFFITAMTDASATYGYMCTALKNLVTCFGSDLVCEGEPWDGICFATYMDAFFEDANVCGDGSGVGSLEEAALGERCLDIMAEVLTANPDNICLYFGEFAKCILTEEQNLEGEVLQAFRVTTRRELRLGWPHKFGNTAAALCQGWNSTYADLLSENRK